ncbi:hypothetical protein DBR43_16350 [Pedobacter sp. KBW06]|uniref:hypothetical protein n=1 Tax=Pedobacter sp. KBW06 TaxID=2153359 RepID=UPI000F5A0138|nr:hypothetical protein [Pedobacter sp. KBW06]RQO69641.1 hypothetical protein DBR43_16350 [Pedobacter sp. KBW06]
MTKREQYGLTFSHWVSPGNGQRTPMCRKDVIDDFSFLQVINYFSINETKFLIEELEKAINGEQYDNYPSSQLFDDLWMELHHPNVHIYETDVIPMTDFKELLEEWLCFLQS